MILEHLLTLFRMCIFHSKGPVRQNQIVCWARSPGDHALHVTQFPIIGVNYFPPEENGFPNEEDVTKPEHTTVFSFPMKTPKGAVCRMDMTAMEQLELSHVGFNDV